MAAFEEVSEAFQGCIAPISKQLIYIFTSLAAGAVTICGECFSLSHFTEELGEFERIPQKPNEQKKPDNPV